MWFKDVELNLENINSEFDPYDIDKVKRIVSEIVNSYLPDLDQFLNEEQKYGIVSEIVETIEVNGLSSALDLIAQLNDEKLNMTEIGTRRGQVRINNEKLSVTEIGTRRGQVRI